jgi:predicted ATPase/DNA-binding SARP family transcriptional activator
VTEFGLLGPLEVRHDNRAVDLGGPRGRALLGMLLVHAGEPVTADALAQALWGDDAPPTAAKALQMAVSRLRHALGPAADRIETVPGGYRLHADADELDASRFESACERARGLPPAEAAAVLREALGLWRGPALADLCYEPWAQAEIRRLEELRAAAIEERVEAELALGEHARIAGELAALVAEYPLRERLRAQQMLALYRAGRHADALAAYRTARAVLDAELGLEPGPELRRLEQAILTHDPALAAPTAARAGIPPEPATPTIGREDDIRAVLAELGRTRLLTLTGPGGVGKTRLAIEVARAAGGRFVSLAPLADAERIPAAICDTLAVRRVPGETDFAAAQRALGSDPALLALDNLEQLPDAAKVVAALLDTMPALTVLATSRQALHLSHERVHAVAPLAVTDDPESSPAVALFAERARARAPRFALTADNAGAIVEICRRLGGLPLAIELAAGRLGVLSPAALAARLGDALAVLCRGPEDAPERQRTLRATLDWSFDLLDAREQDAFTALAVFAGGCDVEAAETVTGVPLAVIEDLVEKSLVTMADGRLTLLEPVRQYAGERLAARPDAAAVRDRHLAHFRALVQHAEAPILRHTRTAPEFARLLTESENLRVAVSWALERAAPLDALALVGDLGALSWSSDPPMGLREAALCALEAAGDDAPPRLRARALFTLSNNAAGSRERLRCALAAADLFRALGDTAWLVRALIVAANASSYRGDFSAGRAFGEEALGHARATGDEQLIGGALSQIALGTTAIADAAPAAREAARHLRAAGTVQLAGATLTTVGLAALREDAYELALELGQEALDDALSTDDPFLLALVYGNLGLAALLSGRHERALAAFRDELLTARANSFSQFYFEGLLGMAALAAAAGADHRAGALEAAAWAHAERPPAEAEKPVYDRVAERFIARARERLEAREWTTAAAAGRAMTAQDAVAFALEEPALAPSTLK